MCSIRIFSIALCIFGKSDKAEVFMNVQYIKAKQLGKIRRVAKAFLSISSIQYNNDDLRETSQYDQKTCTLPPAADHW